MLVVTAWATYGVHALAILLATFACASLALAVTVRCFDGRRNDARPYDVWVVIAIALASTLACVAWPFIFSSDVYAYAAYGDLALRGISPFALAPPSIHDSLIDGARWQWSGTFPPCVYGPGFVAFAAAVVRCGRFAMLDAHGTLAAFRFAAILALLATIACGDRALATFALDARTRTRMLALAALSPVVLWSVAEGHNDIYALLAVVAVVAFAPRGREDRILGYGLPLALCFKASAALAIVPFLLHPIFERRRALGPVIVAAIAGTLAAVALNVPLLIGAARRIATTGRYLPSVSLPQAVGFPVSLAVAVAFVAVALRALRCGHRSGYAWLGLAAFAGLPSPYPWYGVILVPIAVAGGRNPASIGLYAVTICAALRYLPDAFGDVSPGTALEASAVVIAPIVFALTGLAHDLQPEKETRTP